MKYETIAKKYDGLTKNKLYEMLITNSYKYYTITISEEKARKILELYGLPFHYQHQTFKHEFLRLIFYVRANGIDLPLDSVGFDISYDDIMERILENEEYDKQRLGDSTYKEISSLYDDAILKCHTFMDEGLLK